VLPVLSRIARAQTYPTRPVRIIVSFPPGAGNDIMARLMGQALSERLGQPFIIENRPRAAGNIGAEAVVRAPPALSPRHSEARRHGPLRALCPVAAQVRDPHLRRGVRRRLPLLPHKFVGVAKSRCEAWQRAQPRGAILRTRWAANRAVAHPTPRL